MGFLDDTLAGVTPPLVTPFEHGKIDWDAFDDVLDHVLAGGADAVFPLGTTGEAASLTATERREIVGRTVERTPNTVPVLPGISGTAIPEIRRWIEEAASMGAHGVFLTPPFFHQANDPDGYLNFFEAVLEDSPLPIFLYNIPQYVGTEIPLDVVDVIAAHNRLLGLKDSSGDFGYVLSVLERTPSDFLVLQGIDELLLPSLRMGCAGGVNAGANVFPERFSAVLSEPFSERAEAIHRDIVRPLFRLCHEHGFAPGIKAALAAQDVIRRPEVRPPLVSVDPSSAASRGLDDHSLRS